MYRNERTGRRGDSMDLLTKNKTERSSGSGSKRRRFLSSSDSSNSEVSFSNSHSKSRHNKSSKSRRTKTSYSEDKRGRSRSHNDKGGVRNRKHKSRKSSYDSRRKRMESEGTESSKKREHRDRGQQLSSTSCSTSSRSRSSSSSQSASLSPTSRTQSRISTRRVKKIGDGVESESRPTRSTTLLAKIEEKLDLANQVSRLTAIEEIEREGFAPASFKTSRLSKPKDIPLPPLELKSVNLINLKNEILCHPNLILSQKEREDQWIKRLYSLRAAR